MATLTELLLAVRMDRAGLVRLDLGADRAAKFESARRSFAHYVIDGAVVLQVGDQTPVVLQAGDFALLAHGDAHLVIEGRPLAVAAVLDVAAIAPADAPEAVVIGAGGAKLLSAAFGLEHRRGSKAESIVPDLVVLRGGALNLPGATEAAPVGSFLAACEGPGASAFAALFVQMLFAQAIRQRLSVSGVQSGVELGALQLSHIQTAVRLMNGQPDRDWSVGRLARAVGMSRTAFAAAFASAMGDTPVNHLRKLRLERASALLAGREDLSIPDVAAMVGYNSGAAFTRAFRLHFGKAPHAFRRDAATRGAGAP